MAADRPIVWGRRMRASLEEACTALTAKTEAQFPNTALCAQAQALKGLSANFKLCDTHDRAWMLGFMNGGVAAEVLTEGCTDCRKKSSDAQCDAFRALAIELSRLLAEMPTAGKLAGQQRAMSSLFQAQQGERGTALLRDAQKKVWRSSNTRKAGRIDDGYDLLGDGQGNGPGAPVWSSEAARQAVKERVAPAALLVRDAPVHTAVVVPATDTPPPPHTQSHATMALGDNSTADILAEISRRVNPPPQVLLAPSLQALLCGTLDAHSPLRQLAGHADVLELIAQYHQRPLASLVAHVDTHEVGAASIGTVRFPPPSGINVNMMPIIMGSLASLPDELLPYAPLLEACPILDYKVGYLTIHESIVEDGRAQRREGLHTEGGYAANMGPPSPFSRTSPSPQVYKAGYGLDACPEMRWGGGDTHIGSNGDGEFYNGIFMASTVARSTRVWNACITDPTNAIGPMGDLEHMRHVLGEGYELGANELIWMTDTTPHESLPLAAGTVRQYFRLVTHNISVWYADHNTPNPLGVLPGQGVSIVHGDKFKEAVCCMPQVQGDAPPAAEEPATEATAVAATDAAAPTDTDAPKNDDNGGAGDGAGDRRSRSVFCVMC